MKISDAISAGFVQPYRQGTSDVHATVYTSINGGDPVWHIDNVLAYTATNGWHWTWGELPNIAPPFLSMFVESAFPRGHALAATLGPSAKRVGFFLQSERKPDLLGGGWRCMATMYLQLGRRVVGPYAMSRWAVSPSGEMTVNDPELVEWAASIAGDCDRPERSVIAFAPFDRSLSSKDEQVLADMQHICLYDVLLALCFSHCRNVETVAVTPPPKLSKKWRKKTGKALLRYHVLDIEASNRRYGGNRDATEDRRALHICRGHFAHYTAQAPLFGRYVGTVWRPQHTRGSHSAGVVAKDYAVHVREPL